MSGAVSGRFHKLGSSHWTSGPLALVPLATHQRWHTIFGAEEGKALGKLKKRLVVTKGGVFFPLAREVGCFVDKGIAVLVEVTDAAGRRPLPFEPILKAATHVEVDDKRWKEVARVRPEGAHVLCDAVARDPRVGVDQRAANLTLTLDDDEYVIEEIRGVAHRVQPVPNRHHIDVTYSFTRLRPASRVPAVHAAKAARAQATELVASADVIRAARKLRFLDNDQTTSVVLPRKVLPQCDDAAFRRASKVKDIGTIEVAGTSTLVIARDAPMAFWPTSAGGIILVWSGGDSAAGLLAAALAIEEKRWKTTRVRWQVGDGKLALIAASTNGRRASAAKRVDIELPSGIYRVQTAAVQADVRVGTKLEDTMLTAVRLTRA